MFISTRIHIGQKPDIIHQALMIPENFPYWNKHLERFEVVERMPGEVGSLARLHYHEKGRRYFMEDRLIECEPGKRYVSKVEGEAITARVETILRPLKEGTEMILHWEGQGKGFFLKLLLPLLRKKMKIQTVEELQRFKHLVETRGSDFGTKP